MVRQIKRDSKIKRQKDRKIVMLGLWGRHRRPYKEDNLALRPTDTTVMLWGVQYKGTRNAKNSNLSNSPKTDSPIIGHEGVAALGHTHD